MDSLCCPQVKLRNPIATSESGFITRGSNHGTIGHGSQLWLRRYGFQDGRVRRSYARQCRGVGWDGRRDDEGVVSNSWGALCKPIVFPDVTEFVKDLTPMERKLWGAGIVCVLASVAWLRNLAAAGLVDDTEPLFAEAARQM
jgi:hypothetical protein